MSNDVIIAQIRHNTLYIPKKFLCSLNLKNGDKVIIKCHNGCLMVVKHNLFGNLDLLFAELDSNLKSLFISEKKKEVKKLL